MRHFSNLCKKKMLGIVFSWRGYNFSVIAVGNGRATEKSKKISESSSGKADIPRLPYLQAVVKEAL